MISKRGPTWVVTLEDGREIICISEQVAKEQLEQHTIGWKLWTPPQLEEVQNLPLPEVREYDSMEEAIAEED